MSDEGQLTISPLLVYLRQMLIKAREEKNEELLTELGNAFDLIETAAYEAKDKKHGAIAEDMRNAVQDTFMGVQWKSEIPSIADIEEASQST